MKRRVIRQALGDRNNFEIGHGANNPPADRKEE